MSRRPRILVIAFSDLSRDPRVHRHLLALHEDYQLFGCGRGQSPVAGVRPIELHVRSRKVWRYARNVARALRMYELHYWALPFVRAALNAIGDQRFDLVLTNDFDTLPLAFQVAHGAPVVYDAHEYAPLQLPAGQIGQQFRKPFTEHVLHRYLWRATEAITVCDGIADKYADEFHVRRPEIITNASPFHDIEPSAVDERVRMVHVGAPFKRRKLELMLEAVHRLPERYTLDLYFMPKRNAYVRELERIAAGSDRIRFCDPVPMPELPTTIREYDVGLSVIPPTTFNHRHALPNKFFEYVQGRVAVVTGPSPEMARLVREHDLGAVTRDFSVDALVETLRTFTPERLRTLKSNVDQAANVLNAEVNAVKLRRIVARALGA